MKAILDRLEIRRVFFILVEVATKWQTAPGRDAGRADDLAGGALEIGKWHGQQNEDLT
jgi:hypothetical protein